MRRAGRQGGSSGQQARSLTPASCGARSPKLGHGLTLITRNVDEFSRVPDLRLENWAA